MNSLLKNLPWPEIESAAKAHHLDKNLIAAVVVTESAGKSYAFRYEPNFRWLIDIEKYAAMNGITRETEEMAQKCSWGLMQTMGAVVRELGFNALLPELCKIDVGLHYGCRKLALCMDRYHGDVSSAVAAYNAGTARKKDNGEFINQIYVNKVLKRLEDLKTA